MKTHRPVLDNGAAARAGIDTVIEWLLVALLIFMPLAFGVVHAWSEQVVIVIAGGLAILLLAKFALGPASKPIRSWSYLPVALFLAMIALQLLPLPTPLLNLVSPNTTAIKQELLADLPNADDLLNSMTISFYPWATRHDLRLLLAVAAVFAVVLNGFRLPHQIKRLLMAIAVVGGLIAAITLAQDLFGNGKIYWFVPNRHGTCHAGPFVNHSHYGQFMNLSIGAALGLLIVTLQEAFAGKNATLADIFDYLGSAAASKIWLLVAIIAIGAATVFISLTRGGIISMLIASTFTTLLICSKKSLKGHGWTMVGIALVAFVCILYIGFDAVYDRLATVWDFREADTRLQILKDIAATWTGFPVLGTGLGTHSVVYPMFDTSTTALLATYAENEYAQALFETGLIGLSLLVLFAIFVWYNFARTVAKAGPPITSAAYGLGFGLVAILIHSTADFGQHLPANAILSAICCAILLILARYRQPGRPSAAPATTYHGSKTFVLLALCGVAGIWTWAAIDANNCRIAESRWKKVSVIEKNLGKRHWQGTDAEYDELLSHACAAIAHDPENIKYLFWYNIYRWRSLARQEYPNLQELAVTGQSAQAIQDIVDKLHRARAVCPTYGPTYTVVGQIEKFVLNQDDGAKRIRQGFRLAPCDPMACFVAGCLDMRQGKRQEAAAKLDRAVKLDGGLFKEVAKIYVNHLSQPHLALSAAGDDINRLRHVITVFEAMQYYDLAEQAGQRIQHLLETECSQPDAPATAHAALAGIYQQQQNEEGAIQCYRRALALDYSQVPWRLELAKLLAKTQDVQQAMREVKICLRLRPESQASQLLLADFSVHPDILQDEIALP
jgi:tetratricopeptide (TPR) repeat protein/O-antigen ligase